MELLENIVNIEQEYSELTSIPEYYSNYIKYIDRVTPEIPFQNYIYIKKTTTIDEMREIVKLEKEKFLNNNAKFIRFVFDPYLSHSGEIPELSEFSFETNSILILDIEKSDIEFAHNNCFPITYKHKNQLQNLYNELNIDYQVLNSHIERWIDLKLGANNLETVVYSEKDSFLGNCELFFKESIAKLDDFEVLKGYRNRKIGQALLKSAISICKSRNVKILYLLTDSNDWVYDYYLRKGFKVYAEYNSCTLYR